jgi:hypothetical protein
MTNAETARSEQPIEKLQKQPIVLLHELHAVSDSLTSSIMEYRDAMNNAACLSTTLACDISNKNFVADTIAVQVSAAMKKA